MPDPADKPWVLVRKGSPPWRFATLEKAQRMFNQLRFNGGASSDATVFGPGGIEWRCSRNRWSSWVEVTGERRSSAAEREEAGA